MRYLFRYIEYWRQRFAKDGIEQIFPKAIPKEGDPYFGTIFLIFDNPWKLYCFDAIWISICFQARQITSTLCRNSCPKITRSVSDWLCVDWKRLNILISYISCFVVEIFFLVKLVHFNSASFLSPQAIVAFSYFPTFAHRCALISILLQLIHFCVAKTIENVECYPNYSLFWSRLLQKVSNSAKN